MNALFEHFALVNPNPDALLLLYSDMTIMNGTLESDVYLAKALRTCFDLGDIENGYRLLRTNPASLKNPDIFRIILGICTVYDQANGLKALGKLIADGSFDLDIGYLQDLVEHLLRLDELEIAYQLISKFNLHGKVSKIVSLSAIHNPKLAIRIIRKFPTAPLGYGTLRNIMEQLKDEDCIVDYVWLYQNCSMVEIPKSFHDMMLNVALKHQDTNLVLKVLKNVEYNKEALDKIEEAYHNDCQLCLVTMFLENDRKIPSTWRKAIVNYMESLPLPRAYAFVVHLEKHGYRVNQLVTLLVTRLIDTDIDKETEWKHLRIARRLSRRSLCSDQSFAKLERLVKESIVETIHNLDLNAADVIEDASFLRVPIDYQDIASQLHKLPFQSMHALYIHFPFMQHYTSFLRTMLTSTLPTRNVALCLELVRKLDKLGSLNYTWCLRVLKSRKNKSQRKLFYELVNRVHSFSDRRDWIAMGIIVYRSFDWKVAGEFRQRLRTLKPI
jgi:hypothetical protein